ncbi:hypothetical protein DM02DRAFT_201328 [Periconia macrospinosa]|uniref:Rhodopsin domain-containing protein n=1 Tax=Periconia macrospinosa TaxID=97972 RepID=A0A2V1E3T7_9PLEO|nr:hypothetical protein DM02DRAFT_201328 [Periconia macrospinosa]
MLLARGLYHEIPPEGRTRVANNPTLLYSWWCTVFSAALIGTRLCGRYMRNERLFREDKVMALSIIPLFARMGLVHVVLLYGTNNADTGDMDHPLKIHRREIGSKLVLAARIFYALFIWMAKFTVSEFLKRMTERYWKKGYEVGLRGIRIFLVVTFVAVIIATLAECRPIQHYWQVVPVPKPQCRQGYAHLLTMGITDIVTDLLLVIFPIPIILQSAMSIRRKLSLISLFSMSLILIAITSARIPLVIQKRGLQQFRTVFASSEVLAATVVSNAIILGSFLRDRGIKKAKYKAGSTVDSFDRRSSLRRQTTLQQLGSDEDLARSMGFRTNPELIERKSDVPRPAQVADLRLLSSYRQSATPFSNSTWEFPKRESGISEYSGELDLREKDRVYEDPMPSPRQGRRVSFYDVGGLLESGQANVVPSPTDSVLTQDFATQPRRTSRSSLSHMSNGRSAFPSARRSSRLSQHSEDYEMSRPAGQQVDLRAFLSHGDDTSANGPSNSGEDHISPTSPRRSTMRSETSNGRTSAPSLQDAGGLLSSP